MIDCLFIGHNDGSFPDYVEQVRAMGTDAGPWRRLNLAFVEVDGVPHRAMDVLNRVRTETESVAKVESEPRFEGRQMVMVLAPK